MYTLTMPKKVMVARGEWQRVLNEQLALQQCTRPFLLYSGSVWRRHAVVIDGATYYEMPTGEPTFAMLEQVLAHMDTHDAVVAIGGGSVIDMAKAVAALARNKTVPFEQLRTQAVERVPFIAIPTTAGTGSEATKVAVLTDEAAQKKVNPAHEQLVPDVAILDATLTTTLPLHITAFTALDALTHAIEAYVSTEANMFSDMYAEQAIALLARGLQQIQQAPDDVDVREQLLLGSFYAGVAFSNASTNLAHATGRALGVLAHLPHGQSVALMHPFVVTFSYEACQARYDRIAELLQTKNVALYLMQLNVDFHVWESARHLVPLLAQQKEQLTQLALSGNGIQTNRRIPTAQDITHLFTQLQQTLGGL